MTLNIDMINFSNVKGEKKKNSVLPSYTDYQDTERTTNIGMLGKYEQNGQ
jgi:hypothetical protein